MGGREKASPRIEARGKRVLGALEVRVKAMARDSVARTWPERGGKRGEGGRERERERGREGEGG